MKINKAFRTNGTSLWAVGAPPTKVFITEAKLGSIDADGMLNKREYGSRWDAIEHGFHADLRLYFDKKTWNTRRNGLIYTDTMFEKQVQRYFEQKGYGKNTIHYSEQGMQGNTYVSFDIDDKFVRKLLNDI